MGTNSCEIHVDTDKVGQNYYQPLAQAGHEPTEYMTGNTAGSGVIQTPTYTSYMNRGVSESESNIFESRQRSQRSQSPNYSIDFSDSGESGYMNKNNGERQPRQLEPSKSPSYADDRADRPVDSAFGDSDDEENE